MASVVLENVRVDFPIYETQRSLRTVIFQRATGGLIRRQGKKQNRVVVTALSGVSMTLHDGDRVGLIGHNGSGKSTLLKVLAGIYEPIEGRLLVEGSVTPLFDMMPGLDPEENAYENILTSGLLLGMSRAEIEARIPQIEEFSELGEYLSLPVRTYSAGMLMRLGFSLVTSLEPGILLMDEGFGTGDARFAERAEQRVNEFIGRSRIMVMASHSDKTIKAMCNKAVLMQGGRILAIGPVDEVCEKYDILVHETSPRNAAGSAAGGEASQAVDDAVRRQPLILNESHVGELEQQADNTVRVEEPPVDHPVQVEEQPADTPVRVEEQAVDRPVIPTTRPIFKDSDIRDLALDNRLLRTSGAARFSSFVARGEDGKSRWTFSPGETATFSATYEVFKPISDLALLFRINARCDDAKSNLKIVTDIREILSLLPLEVGHVGSVEVKLPNLKLMPDNYLLYVCLMRVDNSIFDDVIDQNINLPEFVIDSVSQEYEFRFGVVMVDHQFRQIEVKDRESVVGGAAVNLQI